MAFESFYAGKQGASIVIKKRFDFIDCPQPDNDASVSEYTYTADEYAVAGNGNILLTDLEGGGNVLVNEATKTYIIKKTTENYAQYNFAVFANDGSYIQGTDCKMPEGHAEGMIQFFRKGAETAAEVDYGEYVIIDTIKNCHSTSNPDNGKIFRRGLDVNNEYAGGIYIGQIVGPKGDTPELKVTSYEELNSRNPDMSMKYPQRVNNEYNMDDGGMVPGSFIDDYGERQFNDSIKYAYTNVYDPFKNLIGCLIGFQFPQLTIDFEGESSSPYIGKIDRPDGTYYYQDLLNEDGQYYDEYAEKWLHPMYQKWQVRIPHGIHGMDVVDLELIPTQLKVEGQSADFSGATLYTDVNCQTPLLDSDGNPIIIRRGGNLMLGDNYNPTTPSALFMYNGQIRYVKKSDCCDYEFRYKERDYSNSELGQVSYRTIGKLTDIQKVEVSENGIMTIFYNNNSPQEIPNKMRWIDSIEKQSVTLSDAGTLRFTFNTLDSDGVNEYVEFPNVFDRIIGAELTEDGQFKLTFNTDHIQVGTNEDGTPIYSNQFIKQLQWIDKVELTETGDLQFFYNTDHNTPVKTFKSVVRTIKDVYIETNKDGDGTLEGTGNQKVHVEYNTGEVDAIGKPLNYIIESAISSREKSEDIAPYHLLIYFSDPQVRAQYADNADFPRLASYPSEKFNGEILTEWVDFGSVKGETGGLKVYTNITDMSVLDKPDGTKMSPEEFAGDPSKEGWGITYTSAGKSVFLMYDYEKGTWYECGEIDYSVVSPEAIIVLDTPIVSSRGEISMTNAEKQENLKTDGLFLAYSTVSYAV